MSDSAPTVDPESQSCYLSNKYCIIMLYMLKAFVITFFIIILKLSLTIRYCGFGSFWQKKIPVNSELSEAMPSKVWFLTGDRLQVHTPFYEWHIIFVIRRCSNNWIGYGGRKYKRFEHMGCFPETHDTACSSVEQTCCFEKCDRFSLLVRHQQAL